MSGLGMGLGSGVSAATALRSYWEGQGTVLASANFSQDDTVARLQSGGGSERQLAPRGNPAYELVP
jgi:hypothetical protein